MKKRKINISKLGYLGNNFFINTLVIFSPLIFILLFNISSEIFSTIDDATCYKLMPASFFKNINLVEKGFSIEIELLSKYLKINRSIVEVPIMYAGRSYSEGKKIKTSDGFKYLFNTLRYRIFD